MFREESWRLLSSFLRGKNLIATNATVFLLYEAKHRCLVFNTCQARYSHLSVLQRTAHCRSTLDKRGVNEPQSSSEGIGPISPRGIPKEENLFYVDWITDKLVPNFMKDRHSFYDIMKICTADVVFSDSIYRRHIEGVNKFVAYASLSKLFLSLFKSECNFTKLGSYFQKSGETLTVLYRFASSKLYSSQVDIVEGALDFRLDRNGKVYEITNRPIRRTDFECADDFRNFKRIVAARLHSSEGSKSRLELEGKHNVVLPGGYIVARSFSSASSNRPTGPEMFQLEHVKKRLEFTVPKLFELQPDYTFYSPDVEYIDEIMQKTVIGRDKFVWYMSGLIVLCKLCYPHVEMEILNVLPILEDGTVRLRWRMKHVSWLKSFMNPKLFKGEYRLKKLDWTDGYSIFHVNADGLVYRIVTRKTMDDEQRYLQKDRLSSLLQKSVSPKTSATYMRSAAGTSL